jgi:hypothetical protein
MEEFIKSIAKQYDLIVESQSPESGWKISLPARGNFICDLHIGSKALEFYVTIFLDTPKAEQVWSDWMDYYGYVKSDSEEKLINDKQIDLKYFIERWMSSTGIRVITKRKFLFKFKIAEWCHNGEWSEIVIYDLSHDR